MEKLLKNPNVLMVGAGVLSFLVARMILNRMDKKSSFDGDGTNNFEPTSSASGNCTCADGTSGYCAGDCSTCCKRLGGAVRMSRFDAFEPSSNVSGCGCGG